MQTNMKFNSIRSQQWVARQQIGYEKFQAVTKQGNLSRRDRGEIARERVDNAATAQPSFHDVRTGAGHRDSSKTRKVADRSGGRGTGRFAGRGGDEIRGRGSGQGLGQGWRAGRGTRPAGLDDGTEDSDDDDAIDDGFVIIGASQVSPHLFLVVHAALVHHVGIASRTVHD